MWCSSKSMLTNATMWLPKTRSAACQHSFSSKMAPRLVAIVHLNKIPVVVSKKLFCEANKRRIKK